MEDISAVRVSLGEAHALIGCELAVSAGDKTLSLLRRGRTKGVVSSQEANSGEFTRDPDFKIPSDGMKLAINARLGPDSVQYLSSQMLADFFLGDTIYANIIVLGASYQAGLIPLSAEALKPLQRGLEVTFNLSSNLFFNTSIDQLNVASFDEPWSRPGDYVLFQAQKDLLCVSSACPSDIEPANDWNPTDIYLSLIHI